MVRTSVVGVAFTCVLLLPPPAAAQQASGVAGVVRDTSGAVLPGVTVEAASPALIEKVRTVVTDGEGQYKIVDLRPGAYIVTFSLTGFNTAKREGIELTAGFTATVNAELRVGSLQETVTVTGASPLVDTHSTRKQTVVSDDLLNALPTGAKALGALIVLTPGLSGTADVGGSAGAYRAMGTPQSIAYHGRSGMKVTYDGMGILNMAGEGNTSYIVNSQVVQEMTLESGGISAESASSGFAANGIPKEGGNRFTFNLSGLFTSARLQSNNLSDELRSRGVTNADNVVNVYDSGLTVGGPVRRDRLWFFTAIRAQGSRNQVAGIFFNRTQGTPFYTPDPDRPGERFEYDRFFAGRMTWQASTRNKVNGFVDIQNVCRCRYEGFEAPEAVFGLHFWPQGLYQITWSSPLTNKLLLEAGGSAAVSNWTHVVQPGASTEYISILELSTNFPYNANATNYQYHIDDDHFAQRFAVSYVTGSHAFKGGVQVEQGVYNNGNNIDRKVGFLGETYGNVSYRFLNGVPNGLTQYATPFFRQSRVKADLGMFVQDQWTVKRLTLNYGVRFDSFNGYVPAQQAPAGQYVPARDFAPVSGVPAWKDINPRLGASYDLFGTGKTAFKVSLGRYVAKTAMTIPEANNPLNTSVSSVIRTWNDANGNYAPDCDLHNPAANGECGAFQDVNFGKNNPSATRYADDVLHGFGARDSTWDFSTEVQHELLPRVSVTGGYYRNWAAHFRVTDNQALAPADYSPYCITAPVDARLPGGGGYQVCGLYDVAPVKFGQINNLVTPASNYGTQTRVSDFFSASVNTRFGSGIQFGGGVDTGHTVADRCFVVDSPQELLNCRVVTPFRALTQVKWFASYPLPGGFMMSGTFQNVAGPQYLADYPTPNAVIAPSLGRNLAACGTRAVCTATATVPLIAPQTQFESRRTQIDLRLSKLFRMGPRLRLQANLDVYNALNANAILGLNNTYGTQWRYPVTSIATGAGSLNGRLFQFSGGLTF